VIQGRIGLDGFHDRPTDQVGVGDLALAEQRAVMIDEAAVLVDDLTGTMRCEVAKGMDALSAMFSAMRAAVPRRGISSSEPVNTGSAAA